MITVTDSEFPRRRCVPTPKIYYYHPQMKFAKVMFSQVFVCPLGEGSLSRGVSVQKGVSVCGSLWRGSQGDPPLYGYVLIVRILLVCSLVWQNFYQKLHERNRTGRGTALDPSMYNNHTNEWVNNIAWQNGMWNKPKENQCSGHPMSVAAWLWGSFWSEKHKWISPSTNLCVIVITNQISGVWPFNDLGANVTGLQT